MTDPPRRRRLGCSRRALLGGAATLSAGAALVRLGLPRWLRVPPPRPVDSLSPGARELVEASFAGLRRELLWDVHAHLVGVEEERTGCWVHPRMRSPWAPLENLRFEIYLAAAGTRDVEGCDAAYVERLLALHRGANPAGKLVLVAFDHHVTPEGVVDLERSPLHTPDDYALSVAARHADTVACVSVHPYREDALERLERAAAAGAVAVKWLPNAMGIDPSSPRCDAAYDRMRELGLVLLSHTGVERAVHAPELQRLGNPLLLRRPLERGLRVVAAHCATLGSFEDLDQEGRPERTGLELFLRLMGEEAFRGLLFGDLSAVTLVNRSAEALRGLLRRSDLHDRLVNGSDYPLPAVGPVISLDLFVHRGLLAPEDRAPLREIFGANPLLFDLVLKRRLRIVEGGRERGFLPVAFETGRLFRS